MKLKVSKQSLVMAAAGFLAGALVILGVRVVRYRPAEDVHYHANFAVYLNGQREQFKNPLYYEEVETCSASKEASPAERAHMHDMVNDVVHVEDEAVTWGQFFQNLGWVVTPSVIKSSAGVLLPDSGHKVTFLINNEKVSDITNRVIKDQDRLLVDYGNTSDQDLQKEFASVPATAHKYDVTQDPASCSGHDEDMGMRGRMRHMF